MKSFQQVQYQFYDVRVQKVSTSVRGIKKITKSKPLPRNFSFEIYTTSSFRISLLRLKTLHHFFFWPWLLSICCINLLSNRWDWFCYRFDFNRSAEDYLTLQCLWATADNIFKVVQLSILKHDSFLNGLCNTFT